MASASEEKWLSPGVGMAILAVGCLQPLPVAAQNSVWGALTEGEVDLNLRLRTEHVDDPTNNNAYAHTLRTALRYETAPWRGLGVELEFEDVRALGEERFNSTVNGKTDRAVVADPEGAEVNRANLWYRGPAETELRVGRQLITYREAPFHRFIGTVAWRQNWQSFDAATLTSRALPDTVMRYAHIFNVNTIFGEDSAQADIDMETDLFNIQYAGLPYADLEGYAYLIENEDTPSASTRTLGMRAHGSWPDTGGLRALYTAELADQNDYRDGADTNDADYWLAELGAEAPLFKVKGSYEVLSGDGTFGFQTPLATKHAFQGWADKFLQTPADGIEDRFVTGILRYRGFTLTAVYHDFRAESGGYDYGEELDLKGTYTLNQHLTLGLKYADYEGDRNATNVARNPGLARDITKFWAFLSTGF